MAKKQKHGPMRSFNFDKRPIDRSELPDPAARVYDSTLSKPGRICKGCRQFVPGGADRCPNYCAES
jgi:hypothetical protein